MSDSKFNPFGDDLEGGPRRVNPFGEEERTESPGEAADKIENAARQIRGLRSQLGSEGLTLSGTRKLLDELTSALDSAARALRALDSG